MTRQADFKRNSGSFRWVVLGLSTFLVLPLSTLARPPQNPPAETSPSQENAVKVPLTEEERGDIHMARKEYADAVDNYFRALKKPGADAARLWNKSGIAYQQEMDYRAAENAYKRAIRLRPSYPEAWNNLGTTFYFRNKAKKSVKYYRKAIQLSPQTASYHMNLGTAFFQRKKMEEAFKEYRVALSLDPNVLIEHSKTGNVVQARNADEKYFFYLAKVFASLGRSEEAVRYLRRAFEEGFHDSKRLENDPDFQKIAANPAYIELVKNPPVAIRD